MPSYLTRCVALLTVTVAFSGDAFAAERASRNAGLKRISNPFAVSIYSRLSSNPFGLPALTTAPVKAPTFETVSNPVTPAPVTAQEPVTTLDSFELTPALLVSRPPYRPPVRSPFRPPPRPPFIP
jgi:hypothetical protein